MKNHRMVGRMAVLIAWGAAMPALAELPKNASDIPATHGRFDSGNDSGNLAVRGNFKGSVAPVTESESKTSSSRDATTVPEPEKTPPPAAAKKRGSGFLKTALKVGVGVLAGVGVGYLLSGPIGSALGAMSHHPILLGAIVGGIVALLAKVFGGGKKK